MNTFKKLQAKAICLCISACALFFLSSTVNQAYAQDNLHFPPDKMAVLYAKDMTSATSVGSPAGFEPGANRASTITVNYNGFTPEAQAAFQYAVDIWESLLTSSQVIVVNANFASLGPTVLGSAGPANIHRNFAGGIPNTWYPTALANAITNSDNNGAGPDINCSFSSDFSWYYGTDANPPAGTFDFVTVVLHELAHGLGFLGIANVDGAGNGINLQDGSSLIWNSFVQNGSGSPIQSFGNGTAALAGQLQGGDLFWNGPSANTENGGLSELYAPNPWDLGSSFSHLDEDVYPEGGPNSLMTPQLAFQEAIHTPGDLGLALLQDMGWSTPGLCGQWYIPNDVDLPNTPMVFVCPGEEPEGYILADQACAQNQSVIDPFCVTSDWDFQCQDAYNACLYGVEGCAGDWYIPNTIAAGPIVFACEAPADYTLADQNCAQQTVNADPFCVNGAWDAICSAVYSCCTGNNGCIDPTACNFAVGVCQDNSLCVYPGCTDPAACNFDEAAACDDGSCSYPGCTNPEACNFDALAGCDDGSCTQPQYYIPCILELGPMVLACERPTDYILANQDCAQERVDIDPFCLENTWDALCQAGYDCCQSLGCTNPFACNYNPSACTDDGSCIPPGCTYPSADNYDPSALCDDGNCTFSTSACPGDLDGSGLISTGDLLILLGGFGSLCEE